MPSDHPPSDPSDPSDPFGATQSNQPPPPPGERDGGEGTPEGTPDGPPSSRASRTPEPPTTTPGRPKRPRYLAVALVGALVFGAGCWTEGCDRMRFYRTPAFYNGEPDPGQSVNASIKSDVDRKRAEDLYQRFTVVADEARKRAFPMAVATWILGAALLAFASRGLAGKTKSRNALVQIVIAQAAVVAATYFVTPDLRNAELDWEMERTLIHQRETLTAEQYEQAVPMMHAVRRFGVPGWLVVRSLLSGLIVFALTRPRSRQFFEAAGKPISEG